MGVHRIHRAATPYPAGYTPGVDYAQTADVMFLAHLDLPFRKLVRQGHTSWTFGDVTFGPKIAPPVGASVVATKPNTTGYVDAVQRYVVTVMGGDPLQESRASAVIQTNNDLTLQGNYNTINLPALPDGAERFVIYKEQAGLFGYIGAATTSGFRDGSPQIQPVLSDTPPQGRNPFAQHGDYPSSVTLHQQRLLLGRTRNQPNGVWGSQSADYENMDVSSPAKPDDAISFALVSDRVNAVNQLMSFDDLLVFSNDAIWAIEGEEGKALTQAINPKKQSGRGATRLRALAIDNVAFFQPSRGSAVRTLGYTYEIEGYHSNDVTLFSPHLFTNNRITSWAYQEEPFSCIWTVMQDGSLLCFTWQQEQQVWGWSRCETNGRFEQVVVITEGGYDRVYALIRRTLRGQERLMIERMALPHDDDYTTACHLDCAVTQVYDPPRNIVDQLWHLEGMEVSATYDGYAAKDLIVRNGKVELPHGYAATLVTVGLPYEGEIETLPNPLGGDGGVATASRQQINEIMVRTIDTKGIEIGASGTPLEQVTEREGHEVAELPDIDARDYKLPAVGDWKDTSTIVIRQAEPFPAHVVGVFFDMKVTR